MSPKLVKVILIIVLMAILLAAASPAIAAYVQKWRCNSLFGCTFYNRYGREVRCFPGTQVYTGWCGICVTLGRGNWTQVQ